MEGFGGPAHPSLAIAQCLDGGYANGATWLGTIHGQAAWIRLRLAVSSAGNTRLEHAPPSGVLISGLSSAAGAVSFESVASQFEISAFCFL
jgi:hypothetical protein